MGFFNEGSDRATAIIELNSDSSELLVEVNSFVNGIHVTLGKTDSLKPKTVSKLISIISEEVELLHDDMLRHSVLEEAASKQSKGSPSAIRMRSESIDRLRKVKELIQDWVDALSRAARNQDISDIENLTMRAMFHKFENWSLEQNQFLAKWGSIYKSL